MVESMKYSFVITGLLLLLLANVLMAFQYSRREAFQGNMAAMKPNLPTQAMSMQATSGGNTGNGILSMANVNPMSTSTVSEGFTSFLLSNAGGAKDKYEAIGGYDGVVLSTGNNVSSWRYTAPNEKLLGDEFVPGDDSLFMFKNNQCKPECCGASFSCDGGGCVCTTPEQRQYLASRGGNRTAPEDSA